GTRGRRTRRGQARRRLTTSPDRTGGKGPGVVAVERRGADGLVDAAGNPLRLLFVHAHPDDETTTTGATVRHYAASGIPVHLVTCTRGERGEILDDELAARLSDPDPDVVGE